MEYPILHGRRKRLEELARREAAGELFWTSTFDEVVRTRLIHAYGDSTNDIHDYYTLARGYILRNEGGFFLQDVGLNERGDVLKHLLRCPDAMVPTVIEALVLAAGNPGLMRATNNWDAAEVFTSIVNTILREHRISYELIRNQMVEFDSQELHVAVVAPTLSLLAGRDDLGKVETAYRKALEEISKNDAGDAITDAGTALQELLTELGCQGDALGDLIKSAKSKGLLAPHDSSMLFGVEKIMHWVSADRSETGDAHKSGSPALADAWFTVHIVGAIILRLSRGIPRGA